MGASKAGISYAKNEEIGSSLRRDLEQMTANLARLTELEAVARNAPHYFTRHAALTSFRNSVHCLRRQFEFLEEEARKALDSERAWCRERGLPTTYSSSFDEIPAEPRD